MISRIVFKDLIHRFKRVNPQVGLSSGVVTIIILSIVFFTFSSQYVFSLDTAALTRGHVHKLLTYSLYHKTIIQLVLSLGVMGLLGSNIEKSLGTVQFLWLVLLLSIITGLLYATIQLLLLGNSFQNQVEGLLPVSLALLSVTTVQSPMTRAVLLGVSVPTLALPWLFVLITSLLVPHTVLLCNIVAIVTGWIYGKGWFSMLNMSESRASILDKKMPFRLLKNIGVLYIPASTEERKKVTHLRITPTPGSYPVQAYAPVSSLSSLHTAEATSEMYEGWSHSSSQASPHSSPHGLSHGYGPGFHYGHSHEQSHGQDCGHNHSTPHGHKNQQGYVDGNSHRGNDSLSQHFHVSPMNMHSGQPVGYVRHPNTFSHDLAPTSVMIDPVAPIGE